MKKQLHARFNRTKISEKDFTEAREYICTLKHRRNVIVKRALLLSAIIAYARPFTPNKNNAPGKPTAKAQLVVDLNKEFTQPELKLHGQLIALRNEALAHSDFIRKATRRVSGNSTGFLTSSKMFDVLAERIDRNVFEAMCTKMISYCNRALFKLNHQINAAPVEEKDS